MSHLRSIAAAVVVMTAAALTGCTETKSDPRPAASTGGPSPAGTADEVAAERAKLTPEDRALAEAQEWCVVQTDERLGSMGPPIKLDIKGHPVFLCCKGCQKKAERDPDATLAKLTELKAKAAAAKAGGAK
jgi:hypothetical protein